jgi:serine/threonine-protein kinase
MQDSTGELVTSHGGIDLGAVLAGKYRIERVLGQGGMGIVVQAVHLQLQQPVAMKFLLPEVLGNQEVVQRFLREAQAAVRLKSEHVARVIDVGTLETGAPYMVLEYLEGTDLASFPQTQLTVGGIIDLMLQACEALAEAHSLGIVHRDIKPANFFITRRTDGSLLLKVLDFGISKISTMNGQLTATQTVMGTPAYMSPEQMRSSRDVDHRSDIWSLGIVLYKLFQGAPPFESDTFSSMVLKVVNDVLPRLTVRLQGDLDQIVYRCLEKDPARRFQDIAELAYAISKYAQSETQAAISVTRTRGIVGPQVPRTAHDPGSAQRASSTISGSVGAMTIPPRSRRRWPILAALVAAIAVATIALRGTSSTERPLPGTRPEDTSYTAPVPGPDTTRPMLRPAIAPTPTAAPAAIPAAQTAAPVLVTTPAPGSAATPPSAAVPVTGPSDAPTTTTPVVPSPRTAASKGPSSAATQATTMAKKPKKTTATVSPSAEPGVPHAKPPSPDDDVLETRR